jgi:hypothetical protein
MTNVWPLEWNVGSTHSVTSSGVPRKTWPRRWQFRNRLECVSSAPLGLPVVPDVGFCLLKLATAPRSTLEPFHALWAVKALGLDFAPPVAQGAPAWPGPV